MILYRTDDISEGAAVTVSIGGSTVALWEKEFSDQELLAASKQGWSSLETIRANRLKRAIKPKGRAALV